MNRRAIIKIDTPVGETESKEVEKIVKQGTVFGPQLCCMNSARIKDMKQVAMDVIAQGYM